jgi:hypothetical protein
MSILLSPKTLPSLEEPLWLPGPESPSLPIDELHLWRVCIEEPRWSPTEECPVSRDCGERIKTSIFRRDIIERYAGRFPRPGIVTGPSSGFRVDVAQCDHLALIAVSRNVREVGLDLERVRDDIPFEEMADGFLDPHSQWDLRITWSKQEKAWKFFRFWTSNEACAQARPSSQAVQRCRLTGFSPEADFIAALAVQGGPNPEVLYWDWQC